MDSKLAICWDNNTKMQSLSCHGKGGDASINKWQFHMSCEGITKAINKGGRKWLQSYSSMAMQTMLS